MDGKQAEEGSDRIDVGAKNTSKNQVRTATNPKAASPGSAPLAAEPKRA